MAAGRSNGAEERLWTLVKILSEQVDKLQKTVETLALSRIATIREELKFANKDRALLRKELLLLHSLLNEQVKDMKPDARRKF